MTKKKPRVKRKKGTLPEIRTQEPEATRTPGKIELEFREGFGY